MGNLKLTGMNILLADDNELCREVTVELLSMYGVNVSFVCDGKEAIDRFLSSSPNEYDAILMDLIMPNVNGIEATRVIRNSKHENAKNIPIIALTASDASKDCLDLFNIKFNNVLTKPIYPNVLLNELRNIKGKVYLYGR